TMLVGRVVTPATQLALLAAAAQPRAQGDERDDRHDDDHDRNDDSGRHFLGSSLGLRVPCGYPGGRRENDACRRQTQGGRRPPAARRGAPPGYPLLITDATLTERVRADLTTAMKAGEKERVGALRLVLSELQKAAKEGDGDEAAVLRRERKRRLDAAEQF